MAVGERIHARFAAIGANRLSLSLDALMVERLTP